MYLHLQSWDVLVLLVDVHVVHKRLGGSSLVRGRGEVSPPPSSHTRPVVAFVAFVACLTGRVFLYGLRERFPASGLYGARSGYVLIGSCK